MKISKRIISLSTIAAIGFSLLSIVPASAALTTVLTMTNPVITVGVGSIATSTFGVTTDDPANTNTITYSFALTTNPGTNLTKFAATSDAVAVADQKAKLLFGGSATVTGYTNSAGTDTIVDTFATGGAAITTNSIRGSISAKPTVVGTYVLTVTATSTGGAASTATLTINAVALNTGSFTISNKSASGSAVACAQSATSNASTTFTAGGGACLSDALTPAGTGVWASGVSGYFGAIATNTTAGGGTGATLTAASPAQADVAPTAFFTGVIAATTVASGIVANTISGMTVTAGANGLLLLNIDGALGNAAATGRMTIGGTLISSATATVRTGDSKMVVPFTAPVVAGTYTASVQVSVGGTYTGVGNDTFTQAFTLTVNATSVYSNSLSQAYIVAGNAGTIATSTTDAVAVAATKTAALTNAGSILINAFKADGTAMTTPGTVTVTVSGSGALSSTFTNTTDTPTASQCSATTNARVVTFTADAVNNVILCADGTAGTGTYTISVTNAAGVTTTLATKTVTFFGSVAKIVATPIFTIGKAAGGTTGSGVAARAALADTPAVVVKATDSAGNVVSGLTISALSSDLTVVNSAITIAADNGTSALTSGGAGFYNASFSTPTSATSGKTATLTFRILDPADVLGVAYLTSAVTITIGGTTVATETLSFDKTAYAPGEAMVVTVTAKDSSGNPVADGTASPAVTFSKAVGGTAIGTSTYVGGKKATSATAPTVFAPVIAGSFSAIATSGNLAGSAITAASSVTDANAGLLTQIDALNAKIVALNALIAKIMKKLGVK